MKRFSLLIGLLFLLSCTNTDSVQVDSPLNGTWHLKNISGSIAGINLDYQLGEVDWTFVESDLQLMVENNIISTGPEQIYSGFQTGTYPYQINTVDGVATLVVNTSEIGSVYIDHDTLWINEDMISDGFFRRFER